MAEISYAYTIFYTNYIIRLIFFCSNQKLPIKTHCTTKFSFSPNNWMIIHVLFHSCVHKALISDQFKFKMFPSKCWSTSTKALIQKRWRKRAKFPYRESANAFGNVRSLYTVIIITINRWHIRYAKRKCFGLVYWNKLENVKIEYFYTYWL